MNGLDTLESEVAATRALIELLAQEVVRASDEAGTFFGGDAGAGLVTLATRQGMRLDSALAAVKSETRRPVAVSG